MDQKFTVNKTVTLLYAMCSCTGSMKCNFNYLEVLAFFCLDILVQWAVMRDMPDDGDA